MLTALGFNRKTHIFLAGAQIYGGPSRLASLTSLYPHLVTKENLLSQSELEPFKNFSSQVLAHVQTFPFSYNFAYLCGVIRSWHVMLSGMCLIRISHNQFSDLVLMELLNIQSYSYHNLETTTRSKNKREKSLKIVSLVYPFSVLCNYELRFHHSFFNFFVLYLKFFLCAICSYINTSTTSRSIGLSTWCRLFNEFFLAPHLSWIRGLDALCFLVCIKCWPEICICHYVCSWYS